MNAFRVLCLGAGLAWGGSALADGSIPDPKVLGTIEALHTYCAKAMPTEAGKYEDQIKELLRGQTKNEIASLRGSGEYRKAYDSVVRFVARVDEHNVKVVCSESVAHSK